MTAARPRTAPSQALRVWETSRAQVEASAVAPARTGPASGERVGAPQHEEGGRGTEARHEEPAGQRGVAASFQQGEGEEGGQETGEGQEVAPGAAGRIGRAKAR